MTNMKILVTGASGLLGRAVFAELATKHEGKKELDYLLVVGTAFSRPGDNLHKVDLTNSAELDNFLSSSAPRGTEAILLSSSYCALCSREAS